MSLFSKNICILQHLIQMGAVYSDSFFALIHYDGMIVDAEDVSAVGFYFIRFSWYKIIE